MRRPGGTPRLVAVVALVAALLGGAAVLLVGHAAGWLGESRTLVVETAGAGGNRGTAVPTATPIPGNSFDPAAIYRHRSPGVVTIYSLFAGHGQNGAEAQGSGFVVSPQGYVLTNSHVITTAGEEAGSGPAEPARQVFVEFENGDRVTGRIVGWDLFSDIGVVKLDPADHELTPVPLGDSSHVAVGEPVAAIGSPFGQTGSLTVGVVSATQRSVSSLTSVYNVVDAIQTDAPINRGNSGGPLFDARGDVIGINAQIRSESGNAEGVGFAIPINTAKRSMEQLIATGHVRYAWIGVSTQTVTPSIAAALGLATTSGAAVQQVVQGSPAQRAGLQGGDGTKRVEGLDIRRGGDVIVAIDGTPVRTAEDLSRLVAGRLSPGQTVRFTVLRSGKRTNVSVTLGERPQNPDTTR